MGEFKKWNLWKPVFMRPRDSESLLFNMGGNQIGAKTLDLNKDFPLIAAQLDKLAEDYFQREKAVNE